MLAWGLLRWSPSLRLLLEAGWEGRAERGGPTEEAVRRVQTRPGRGSQARWQEPPTDLIVLDGKWKRFSNWFGHQDWRKCIYVSAELNRGVISSCAGKASGEQQALAMPASPCGLLCGRCPQPSARGSDAAGWASLHWEERSSTETRGALPQRWHLRSWELLMWSRRGFQPCFILTQVCSWPGLVLLSEIPSRPIFTRLPSS